MNMKIFNVFFYYLSYIITYATRPIHIRIVTCSLSLISKYFIHVDTYELPWIVGFCIFLQITESSEKKKEKKSHIGVPMICKSQ